MFLHKVLPSLRRSLRAHEHWDAGKNTGLTKTLVFALGFSTVLCAFPARADVLDISQDGLVTVYKVPSIFRTEGVNPIPVTVAKLQRFRSPATPAPAIGNLLAAAASRYAIRVNLLTAMAWRESHFRADAVSPKGAVGVMQLMEGTARGLGVDRYDLSQNILGGAAYFRQLMNRFEGNEALALAAYNAGPQAVGRANGIPNFRETRDYVSAILDAPSFAISKH